jgi:hypothetical protein
LGADHFQVTSHFDRRSNTDSPESLLQTSKTILTRVPQFAKQDGAIFSTVAGIEIEQSDEQSAKANSPNAEIFQPGSNVTFERFLQRLKQ